MQCLDTNHKLLLYNIQNVQRRTAPYLSQPKCKGISRGERSATLWGQVDVETQFSSHVCGITAERGGGRRERKERVKGGEGRGREKGEGGRGREKEEGGRVKGGYCYSKV